MDSLLAAMPCRLPVVLLVGVAQCLSTSTILNVKFRHVHKGGEIVGDCEEDATEWAVRLYPRGRDKKDKAATVSIVPKSSTKRICATFAVLLIGQQKFNIEGRGGGILVRDQGDVDVNLGQFREVACPLVVPRLLEAAFVDGEGCVNAVVNITEHKTAFEGKMVTGFRDEGRFHVGSRFVPVWRSLEERRRLGLMGCYCGVDYVVERVVDDEGEERFDVADGTTLSLRPAYPLVRRLERQWPVDIPYDQLGILLRSRAYTAFSALTTVFAALGALAISTFLAAFVVSATVVESLSMYPTIRPGDVIVVEKLSVSASKLLLGGPAPRLDEVVFFSPPPALKEIVPQQKNSRDLFVKRVVGLPGDVVDLDDADMSLTINGERVTEALKSDPKALDLLRRLRNDERNKVRSVARKNERVSSKRQVRFPLQVPRGTVFVVGDFSDVSIDSRIWGKSFIVPSHHMNAGPLPDEYIAGHPMGTLVRRRALAAEGLSSQQ